MLPLPALFFVQIKQNYRYKLLLNFCYKSTLYKIRNTKYEQLATLRRSVASSCGRLFARFGVFKKGPSLFLSEIPKRVDKNPSWGQAGEAGKKENFFREKENFAISTTFFIISMD